MSDLLTSMKMSGAPLGGVMFLAMNLVDAPVIGHTQKHFDDSYAPKVPNTTITSIMLSC